MAEQKAATATDGIDNFFFFLHSLVFPRLLGNGDFCAIIFSAGKPNDGDEIKKNL